MTLVFRWFPWSSPSRQMVKQKMKTLLACSYSLNMWHNLIMKSKFWSEICFNFCKIGTCILQMVQVCEEQ
jgi:hypothetical protein